jgi:hypothetical protein
MNNLEIGNIYTFKLTTGEEIVAKLITHDEPQGYITINHPILTVLGPQGLQMMPGLFSADLAQDVRLNTHSWVLVAETREDVRDGWIRATTGIEPVRKQIITG